MKSAPLHPPIRPGGLTPVGPVLALLKGAQPAGLKNARHGVSAPPTSGDSHFASRRDSEAFKGALNTSPRVPFLDQVGRLNPFSALEVFA